MRFKKPEAVHIQGICVMCNVNKQMSRGGQNYRPVCSGCHYTRSKGTTKPYTRGYRVFRKTECEECGFVPIHLCQLDVDHIDGNKKNNEPSNLRTLCANCHRLKTFQNRDWEKGEA